MLSQTVQVGSLPHNGLRNHMQNIYQLVPFDTAIIKIQNKNGSRRVQFLQSNKGTDLRPNYLSQSEKGK